MTRALLLLLAPAAIAAPVVGNPGFESGLDGWDASGVTVESGFAHEGGHRLDLQAGSVEQTITGLAPGITHTVRVAYLAQAGTGTLAEARVLIDGVPIGTYRTGQTTEYLAPNGFEFSPAATEARLRIESLETGSEGLLIDSIRITAGPLPPPPEQDWANLSVATDARGGRRLVNGGFESPLSDPATDPDNSGPAGNDHLTGTSLPGWRVTRENVDVIQFGNANPPEGTNACDLNGHGPGAIAQTLTGLVPRGAYTISFLHARHADWGSGPMTGEVLVNGRSLASLTRAAGQTWNDGYAPVAVPCLADESGRLALEVRSTTLDLGGGIIYDDFRISSGADFFTPWSTARGVTPSFSADDDGDGFANGLEFLLGLDPTRHEPALLPGPGEGGLALDLFLVGEALAQGLGLDLEWSADLQSWHPASEIAGGISIASDDSLPGLDGHRAYTIETSAPSRFVRLRLITP